MRFAILGNHPDGLETARALAASGRHQLLVFTTPLPDEFLRAWGPAAQLVPDLEEVLADPAIDAVLVAGSPVNRPTQLRRALQSERHVLCVHPADQTPDAAYEAVLIQRDTRCVLLPLLPEALHPGVVRLAELCRPRTAAGLGRLRLVELERAARGAVLLDGGTGRRPALPGWDVLRRLGGEVAEVTAFAEREALSPDAPVFVSGRFEQGGLFRASYLPHQAEARWRLSATGEDTRAELSFPEGWPGPAVLRWDDEAGATHEERWPRWDPWRALVEAFDAVAEGGPASALRPRLLTWQAEVRCLELDDAARRSAERRRATVLEYPDATEEAGFKGTMTLVGCGLLLLVLLLAVFSAWVPKAGYAILPLLALFLVLQFLVSLARPKQEPAPSAEEKAPAGPGTSGQ
jgi:predicted dehydrogenase